MDKIYLSPYFTLGEMTSTKTGLDNTPNVEQINQLRLLCNHILEPLRLHGECAPIIVNSAFRSPALGISSLTQFLRLLSLFIISCIVSAIFVAFWGENALNLDLS